MGQLLPQPVGHFAAIGTGSPRTHNGHGQRINRIHLPAQIEDWGRGIYLAQVGRVVSIIPGQHLYARLLQGRPLAFGVNLAPGLEQTF